MLRDCLVLRGRTEDHCTAYVCSFQNLTLGDGMRGDRSVSRYVPVAISDVEASVLKCLLEGMTHARIAAALDITEQDARTHVRLVLAKLRASSKAEVIQAARLAISN